MNKVFHGYNPPTTAQLKAAWGNATFVLDTNVLLDIYRVKPDAQAKIFEVFTEIRDSLWIPHHVVVEFLRNRITVLKAQRDTYSRLSAKLDSLETSANDLIEEMKSLDAKSGGFDFDHSTWLSTLKSHLLEVKGKCAAAVQQIPSIQPADDEIYQKLLTLLRDKIGDPFKQTEIDEICAEGVERYAQERPPGFQDAKSKGEESFWHGDRKYLRKFGDLIIWKEVLRFIADKPEAKLFLITGDIKSDWWWKESGQRLGAHPSLAAEFLASAPNGLFNIYTLESLLQHHGTFKNRTVPQEVLDDVRSAETSPDETDEYFSGERTNVQRWRHRLLERDERLHNLSQYGLKSPTLSNSSDKTRWEWLRPESQNTFTQYHFDIVNNYVQRSFPQPPWARGPAFAPELTYSLLRSDAGSNVHVGVHLNEPSASEPIIGWHAARMIRAAIAALVADEHSHAWLLFGVAFDNATPLFPVAHDVLSRVLTIHLSNASSQMRNRITVTTIEFAGDDATFFDLFGSTNSMISLVSDRISSFRR